jgi:hypothetical protein
MALTINDQWMKNWEINVDDVDDKIINQNSGTNQQNYAGVKLERPVLDWNSFQSAETNTEFIELHPLSSGVHQEIYYQEAFDMLLELRKYRVNEPTPGDHDT